VVCCYSRVAWSVNRSITLVSPAKTDEMIQMPFGLNTLVGPRNHVLDGGPDAPMRRGNFEGEKGRPIVNYRDTAVVCAKTAEPIEMPFGLWARMGPRDHVLDGGPDPPMGRGNFRGKGAPIVKYRDTLWSPVRKRLNQSSCHLDCDLGMAQ